MVFSLSMWVVAFSCWMQAFNSRRVSPRQEAWALNGTLGKVSNATKGHRRSKTGKQDKGSNGKHDTEQAISTALIERHHSNVGNPNKVSEGDKESMEKPGSEELSALFKKMSLLPDFDVIKHVGGYCWNPSGLAQKDYRDMTAEDILTGLREKTTPPDRAVALNSIRLPLTFPRLNPQFSLNKFPNNGGVVVGLHVAKELGVDLKSIDFVLGGSSLSVLATQQIERRDGDDDTKYLAQICPSTNAILLCKSKVYTTNYADIGFQFERLITGHRIDGKHDLRKFESLQIVKMGGYTVLFIAETDAIDANGDAVEIKSANPHYFGMKVMFQMLSSGSQKLIMANRRGPQLSGIRERSITDMINEHSTHSLKRAMDNIIQGLSQLKQNSLINAESPVEVDFDRQRMEVKPCAGADLLPSTEVVTQLISG